MDILSLKTEEDFKALCTPRSQHHFFIFKHSSICTVSVSAREEILEYLKNNTEIPVYELEVREQRPLSNLISEQFNIRHESPQLILIKDGNKPIWHCSHFLVTEENIENAVFEHECIAG